MSSSYYDVVILGTHIGPLTAAALLAKRGFRVLVLSQDTPAPTYFIADHELPREPLNFQYVLTPIAQTILGELGLRQEVRQRLEIHSTGVQLCLPNHRFNLSTDPERFAKEISREFPKIQTPILDFARRTHLLCQHIEAQLQHGFPWPPHDVKQWFAFLYQTHKVNRLQSEAAFDLLADFPANHTFVSAIHALANQWVPSGDLSNLQIARVFELNQNTITLRGGFKALQQILLAKINAHGGEVWNSERAASVILERNTATGIRLHNSGQTIAAGRVIAGSSLTAVMQMVEDRRPFEKLLEKVGEPRVRCARYTLNLVLPRQSLPEAMSFNTLVLNQPSQPLFDGNLLHIQRLSPVLFTSYEQSNYHNPSAADSTKEPSTPSEEVLCIQALLSQKTLNEVKSTVRTLRQTIIQSVERFLPFISRSIVFADSPHDGLDADDHASGTHITSKEPWSRGPRTMPLDWDFPVRPTLGLGAIPLRTPVRNLLLCNSQNIPGLGDEGSLMAAWACAEHVCRADKGRSWLRKGRWYSQTYAS